MKLTPGEARVIWGNIPAAVKERVRRGASLLDKRTRRSGGRRWPDRIDLAKLDMALGYPEPGTDCGCVCKQLFGSYDEGRARLGLDLFAAAESGGAHFGFVHEDESYKTLDKAWSALITMEQEHAQ